MCASGRTGQAEKHVSGPRRPEAVTAGEGCGEANKALSLAQPCGRDGFGSGQVLGSAEQQSWCGRRGVSGARYSLARMRCVGGAARSVVRRGSRCSPCRLCQGADWPTRAGGRQPTQNRFVAMRRRCASRGCAPSPATRSRRRDTYLGPSGAVRWAGPHKRAGGDPLGHGLARHTGCIVLHPAGAPFHACSAGHRYATRCILGFAGLKRAGAAGAAAGASGGDNRPGGCMGGRTGQGHYFGRKSVLTLPASQKGPMGGTGIKK